MNVFLFVIELKRFIQILDWVQMIPVNSFILVIGNPQSDIYFGLPIQTTNNLKPLTACYYIYMFHLLVHIIFS